jgi:hypothetical protein
VAKNRRPMISANARDIPAPTCNPNRRPSQVAYPHNQSRNQRRAAAGFPPPDQSAHCHQRSEHPNHDRGRLHDVTLPKPCACCPAPPLKTQTL